MTIESRELFELCRSVYEATGWGLPYDGKNDLFVYRQDGTSSHKITSSMNWGEKIVCPLYTSDYLLEKLPFRTKYTRGDGRIAKGWCYLVLTYADNGQSVATYANRNKEWIEPFYSDTPLKALLKLTLKLHDEEVL